MGPFYNIRTLVFEPGSEFIAYHIFLIGGISFNKLFGCKSKHSGKRLCSINGMWILGDLSVASFTWRR